jgi:hypothetical protein
MTKVAELGRTIVEKTDVKIPSFLTKSMIKMRAKTCASYSPAVTFTRNTSPLLVPNTLSLATLVSIDPLPIKTVC